LRENSVIGTGESSGAHGVVSSLVIVVAGSKAVRGG